MADRRGASDSTGRGRGQSRGDRGRGNRGGSRGGRGGGGGGGGGGNQNNEFRSREGGGAAQGAGAGHGQGQGQGTAPAEKKRENILDLNKYMDKQIRVRFNGGREVTGLLKGYDQLMNLVLDGVKERTQDDEGNTSTRDLGLLVARGTLTVLISPVDGSEVIDNPFLQAEDGEGAVMPTA